MNTVYKYIYQRASNISFLVQLKREVDRYELNLFFLKRRAKYFFRLIFSDKHNVPKKKMCILCVKRPEYVEAAILNINSLHYQNSHYICEIYCDEACFNHFKALRDRLDYPSQVSCINEYKKVTRPWQFYKLKTLLKISLENGFLVDADSRWFSEPNIWDDKVMFLTPAHRISDSKTEMLLLTRIFPRYDVGNQVHYATGFLSVPKGFLTKKVIDEIWKIYDYITKNTIEDELVRLRDEISINVAFQKNISQKSICALKDHDGPGDKRVLMSYYYGCWNRIIN